MASFSCFRLGLWTTFPLCVFFYPANIYLFKVINRNNKKLWNMYKINNKDSRTTFDVILVTPFTSKFVTPFTSNRKAWKVWKVWHSEHCEKFLLEYYPANFYLLKVNNRNTRKRSETCSKLTIKTPEQRHWRRSGAFIVNFEHISHFVLVFLLIKSY